MTSNLLKNAVKQRHADNVQFAEMRHPWYDQFLTNEAEDQPRDDHGRWTTGSGGVGDRVDAWLDKSSLSDEKRSQLKEAFQSAHDGLPKAAAREAMANIKEIKFHPSIESLTNQARQEGMWVRTGQKVGGLAITESGESKCTLHLDGGDEHGEGYGDLAKHLMSHELGHAIDINERHSRTSEWRDAYNSEIKRPGDPLSKRGSSTLKEAFAEYSRLMVVDRSKAEKDFPKCHAYWMSKGLLED